MAPQLDIGNGAMDFAQADNLDRMRGRKRLPKPLFEGGLGTDTFVNDHSGGAGHAQDISSPNGTHRRIRSSGRGKILSNVIQHQHPIVALARGSAG